MSLEVQEENLRKYIKNNWLEFDEWRHIFKDEWVSGVKEDREWLKSLMKAAERNEFDIVLVYKIDRFFRKILLLIEYITYLWDYDVWFISTTQGDFNMIGPQGKLQLSILWALAEMERDLIRERTMEWKRKKAELGFYVWWWKPPYWYKFIKLSQWVKLEVEEDEKRVVNKIYELYTKEKKTLWEISKILERDWEETRDDKIMKTTQWKWTKKNSIWRWHTQVISRILQEERYTWKYYYGKTRKEKEKNRGKLHSWEKKTVSNDKKNWIELSCPPILEDFSLFERAAELIERNKKTRNTKTWYPLTWLLFCWHCWKSYIGYPHSKNNWYSYRCNWKRKYSKLNNEPKCTNREVSWRYLLDEIWNKIYDMFKSPDNALKKYYNEKKSHSDIKKFEKQLWVLKNNIEKHSAAIKQAIKEKLYSQKDMKNFYDELIDDARKKIKEAEVWIIEISQKISSLRELEYAKNNLYRLKELYHKKIEELTEEKKIEIIQEVVYKATVNLDGSITVIFRFENPDDDDWSWKKPKKSESTFLDEIEIDKKYWSIKNFKQKLYAVTSSTIIWT